MDKVDGIAKDSRRKRKACETALTSLTGSRGTVKTKKADSYEVVDRKRPKKQSKKVETALKPLETHNNLLDLPTEVLSKILNNVSFDDLFRIERVCKRLRRVALQITWPSKTDFTHESVVENSRFPVLDPEKERMCFRMSSGFYNFERHYITNKSVKTVFSRAPKIHTVDLALYHRTLNYQVSSFFFMIPHLKKLDLSFIRLTNRSLESIASGCTLLEEVAFEQCFSDGKVERGLEKLFTECRNIKYLNLAENSKLFGESFHALPTGLLYLNLANSYNVNTSSIEALVQRATNLETFILENYDNAAIIQFNDWIAKLTKLRFLEISNVFMGQDHPALDFSSLTELEVLSLKYNTLVKLETFRSLQQCKKLRSLDIGYCHEFNDAAFDWLKSCKTLEHLSIKNCTQLVDIFGAIKALTSLEYLNISECIGLSDETVAKILVECTPIRQLEIPHVNHSKVMSEAFKVEKRQNFLQLILPLSRAACTCPSPSWCEIIHPEVDIPISFPKIRNQYYPH